MLCVYMLVDRENGILYGRRKPKQIEAIASRLGWVFEKRWGSKDFYVDGAGEKVGYIQVVSLQ